MRISVVWRSFPVWHNYLVTQQKCDWCHLFTWKKTGWPPYSCLEVTHL